MDNNAAIYGLRQQINQKQRRIEDLRQKISRLHEENDALYNARIKTVQYHDDFTDSLVRQRLRASAMADGHSNRVAGSYPAFLGNRLDGNLATGTAESFRETLYALNSGIQSCEDNIYSHEQEIHRLNDEIRELQNRIGYLGSLR